MTIKNQVILQGSTCKDVDSYLGAQRMANQDDRVQINTFDGTLSSYRYGRQQGCGIRVLMQSRRQEGVDIVEGRR